MKVLLLLLVLSVESSRLFKSAVKEPMGFDTLAKGSIIDERFLLVEKVKWYTKDRYSQLWKAVSTNDNNALLIKFYSNYLSTEEVQPLLRRRDNEVIQKALKAEQEQTQLGKKEEGEMICISQVIAQEEQNVPEKSFEPESEKGILYEKYMHIPLITLYDLPRGDSLNTRCNNTPCKEMLKPLAKNVLTILDKLTKSQLFFGNIHQDNLFVDVSNTEMTMANMQNNQLVKESSKALGEEFGDDNIQAAQENDLKDLGVLLVWMLVKDKGKDTSFLKGTKTSLELFKSINKEKKLKKYIDFNLGVAKAFTEGKENKTVVNLQESFYDFVMKLMGKKMCEENTHEAFDSIESALGHPFLSKDIPSSERPSDVRF